MNPELLHPIADLNRAAALPVQSFVAAATSGTKTTTIKG